MVTPVLYCTRMMVWSAVTSSINSRQYCVYYTGNVSLINYTECLHGYSRQIVVLFLHVFLRLSVLFYWHVCLSPAQNYIIHTSMARYSLFMLKAPLNTNQPTVVKLRFALKSTLKTILAFFGSRDCWGVNLSWDHPTTLTLAWRIQPCLLCRCVCVCPVRAPGL